VGLTCCATWSRSPGPAARETSVQGHGRPDDQRPASLERPGRSRREEPAGLAWQRIALRSAAETGKAATAGRENTLVAKHHALFTRIDQRLDHYLRFATDPSVPSGNNASEREIRMCKLRIKVSGCMRSMRAHGRITCSGLGDPATGGDRQVPRNGGPSPSQVNTDAEDTREGAHLDGVR
jgi:hypothetical protein